MTIQNTIPAPIFFLDDICSSSIDVFSITVSTFWSIDTTHRCLNKILGGAFYDSSSEESSQRQCVALTSGVFTSMISI